MPLYESVFITRQEMTPSQVETLTGEVESLIKKQGGKVAKTEQWGLRTLAYRIRKNKKGHYVLMNIEGPSAAVQEMERTMRINEDVLRYMTVRVEAFEEGPSAVLRKSNDDAAPGEGGFGGPREGRGPRGDGRGDGRALRPRRERGPSDDEQGE